MCINKNKVLKKDSSRIRILEMLISIIEHKLNKNVIELKELNFKKNLIINIIISDK